MCLKCSDFTIFYSSQTCPKNTEVSISTCNRHIKVFMEDFEFREILIKIQETELRYLRRKIASLESLSSADFGLNSNTLSMIQKYHKEKVGQKIMMTIMSSNNKK